MAVNLSPIGNLQQWFDNLGHVLAGGKIFTYAAGTTTPQITYTNNSGSTPNSNPLVLDSTGRFPGAIWLTAQTVYKFVITDANNNTIATLDNISGVNDVQITSVTPAGTVMLFPQTTVPTGWSRINTFDDAAIRVVGSGVPGSGGSSGFISKLINPVTIDSHTLTTNEIPAHSHTINTLQNNGSASGGIPIFYTNTIAGPVLTSTSAGGGGGHVHTVTLAVKYLDVMICSKN
jgi:hypothetical protein